MPEFLEYVDPPRISMNSFQAELFYNGQIRFTYLGVDVMNAIVGLSDGSGTPTDPAEIFPNVRSADMTCDFTSLSSHAPLPYFEPIAPLYILAGQKAEFNVTVVIPEGLYTPVLAGEWDGPIPVIPFTDDGNGTGRFQWLTTRDDHGNYTLRLTANAGNLTCFQDVPLHIGYVETPPDALNIRLRSGNMAEDPTQDRIISYGTDIKVEYDYYHPKSMDDILYMEGATEISWYKNSELSIDFHNCRMIPVQAIRPGDVWYCTVTPWTIYGENGPIEGMTRRSPTVTVLALPEIMNVLLAEDVPAGLDPQDLPLPDMPIASGPCAGGTQLVILGHRLKGATTVKIGGIEAENVRVVSDWRIDVTAAAHIPSVVVADQPIPEQLLVNSPTGMGRYSDAFIYTDGENVPIAADVNKDGKVNVLDVQLVIKAVLEDSKSNLPVDVNLDGQVNAADIQMVVNVVLR